MQKSNKTEEEEEEESDDGNPSGKTNSIMNNKKLRKKGNSLQSIQRSENPSSASSDRENRKEIVLR